MTQTCQLVNTPAACRNKEFCLLKSASDLTMAANSTLMFSGFNPNSRNSSKVLRPPGGGSSDIFGVKDDQEQERVDSPVQQEKDSETEAPNNASNEIKLEETDIVKEEDKASSASTETPPATSSVQETSATPSPCPPVAGVRGRVPPGGHSSGSFW